MLKGDHLELLSLDPEKAMFKIFLSFLVTIELIFVYTHWASLVVQIVKNYLQCKRLGSIPGLGKYPGEENGYPLQYSCLENSMDRGAWQVTVHRVTKS